MLKYIVENGNFSNKDIIKLLKDQEFFERIYSIPPEKCFIINLFNVDNVLLCVIYQLNFRRRASCLLGQAFRYSPENAFYIFNQQIYFVI